MASSHWFFLIVLLYGVFLVDGRMFSDRMKRQYGYDQQVLRAQCELTPSGSHGLVQGLITLSQLWGYNDVFVEMTISGLTPGEHGFHLHRDGSTADMCLEAGPHFNPENNQHGSPDDSENSHAGDFGNIRVDSTGMAHDYFYTSAISLMPGTRDSALGRTFVVQADRDDLGKGGDDESRRTGNSGARVACCVVTPVQ